MARVLDQRNSDEVRRLLAGAAQTIATARYCWLATVSGSEDPSLRPMGRLPPEPGDGEWTFRFVTDGRSRKASDIRRAGKAALVFQQDADEAYLTLTGAASLELSEFGSPPPLEESLRSVLSDRVGPSEWGVPRSRGRAAGALDPRRHARAVRIAGDDARTRWGGRVAADGRQRRMTRVAEVRRTGDGRRSGQALMRIGKPWAAGIGVLSLAASACSPALAGGRVLTASDVITIRVIGQPDLDTTTRIEPDGTIGFPYVGRIRAAGRTEDEVARAVERRLVALKIIAGP